MDKNRPKNPSKKKIGRKIIGKSKDFCLCKNIWKLMKQLVWCFKKMTKSRLSYDPKNHPSNYATDRIQSYISLTGSGGVSSKTFGSQCSTVDCGCCCFSCESAYTRSICNISIEITAHIIYETDELWTFLIRNPILISWMSFFPLFQLPW